MAAGRVATSKADCAEELMTNISHTTEKTYHNLERVAFWKHNGVLKPALLQIGLKIGYSTKPHTRFKAIPHWERAWDATQKKHLKSCGVGYFSWPGPRRTTIPFDGFWRNPTGTDGI